MTNLMNVNKKVVAINIMNRTSSIKDVSFFAEYDPEETVIFSDMTGTILNQQEDGFTYEQKKVILDFITAGGSFNVVTGDSYDVALEVFLYPLLEYIEQYSFSEIKGALNIITGSGYMIHSLEMISMEPVERYRGHDISTETNSAILNRINEIVGGKLGANQKFNSLFNEYARKDVKADWPDQSVSGRALLESSNNKVTLYFPDDIMTNNKLFNAIINDPEINKIAQENDLRVSHGEQYIDIITCTKKDGLDQIISSGLVDIKGKDIIAIGDSKNDAPMFVYTYSDANSHANVFVGSDAKYANEISGVSSLFIWTQNEFTKGTNKVLNAINLQ